MNEQHGAGPTGTGVRARIQYSWIGESWGWFKAAPGTWISCKFAVIGLFYVPLISIDLYFMKHAASQVAHIPGAGLPPLFANPFYLPQTILTGWAFNLFVFPFIDACLLGLANRQVRGYPIGIKDVLAGAPWYGRLFVYNTLFQLPGLILLAIWLTTHLNTEGFTYVSYIYYFVMRALMLPVPAMVADGVPVKQALVRAFAATKLDWPNAMGFVLVFFLLWAASLIPCGLGLLIVSPMAYIIAAIAYRDLIGMPGMATSTISPSGTEQWPPAPRADM